MMNTETSSGAPPFLKLLAHDIRWDLLTALTRSDRRVNELTQIVHQPPNLVSYHLKQLRAEHLVSERRSSADARDIYYTADRERLHTLFARVGTTLHPAFARDVGDVSALPAAHVLFLCTANSARSQLAEGLLRHMSGGRLDVSSAGSAPDRVHPSALRILREWGIATRDLHATHIDAVHDQPFDYVITLCDRMREVCPRFPGQPDTIHWSIPDPVDRTATDAEQDEAFRQTANELTRRLWFLLSLIVAEGTPVVAS